MGSSHVAPDTCIFYKIVLKESNYEKARDFILQSENKVLLNEVDKEFKTSLLVKFEEIYDLATLCKPSGILRESVRKNFLKAPRETLDNLYDLAKAITQTRMIFDRYRLIARFWGYMFGILAHYQRFVNDNGFDKKEGGNFSEYRRLLVEMIDQEKCSKLKNDLSILAEAWAVRDRFFRDESMVIITFDPVWFQIKNVIGKFAELEKCDC
jgi:hypothetical protein